MAQEVLVFYFFKCTANEQLSSTISFNGALAVIVSFIFSTSVLAWFCSECYKLICCSPRLISVFVSQHKCRQRTNKCRNICLQVIEFSLLVHFQSQIECGCHTPTYFVIRNLALPLRPLPVISSRCLRPRSPPLTCPRCISPHPSAVVTVGIESVCLRNVSGFGRNFIIYRQINKMMMGG